MAIALTVTAINFMGDGLRDALDPAVQGMMTDLDTVARPATVAETAAARSGDVLLEVRDLRTYFHVMDGTVRAVDGVELLDHARRDARASSASRAAARA